MIVEGQGMGFWTRVRLPSTPFNEKSRKLKDFSVKSRVCGFFHARIYKEKLCQIITIYNIFCPDFVQSCPKKRHSVASRQLPSWFVPPCLSWNGDKLTSLHDPSPTRPSAWCRLRILAVVFVVFTIHSLFSFCTNAFVTLTVSPFMSSRVRAHISDRRKP